MRGERFSTALAAAAGAAIGCTWMFYNGTLMWGRALPIGDYPADAKPEGKSFMNPGAIFILGIVGLCDVLGV